MRAQAIAGLELLAELFPAAFSVYEPRRRPLKVGISADIAAQLDGAITAEELSAILRRYTSSKFYLEKMLAGQWRFDITGQPCGSVTKGEEQFAKIRLAAISARRTRPCSPPLEPIPAADASKQKLLSLADLREAARARKAGGAP